MKPPDPIVADLLFDLGNVAALTLTLEHAAAVYKEAIRFGPARATLVARRHAAAVAGSGATLSRLQWGLRLFSGAVALAMVGAWLVRRIRRP